MQPRRRTPGRPQPPSTARCRPEAASSLTISEAQARHFPSSRPVTSRRTAKPPETCPEEDRQQGEPGKGSAQAFLAGRGDTPDVAGEGYPGGSAENGDPRGERDEANEDGALRGTAAPAHDLQGASDERADRHDRDIAASEPCSRAERRPFDDAGVVRFIAMHEARRGARQREERPAEHPREAARGVQAQRGHLGWHDQPRERARHGEPPYGDRAGPRGLRGAAMLEAERCREGKEPGDRDELREKRRPSTPGGWGDGHRPRVRAGDARLRRGSRGSSRARALRGRRGARPLACPGASGAPPAAGARSPPPPPPAFMRRARRIRRALRVRDARAERGPPHPSCPIARGPGRPRGRGAARGHGRGDGSGGRSGGRRSCSS